jgi:dTDP-glucose 4,6-dehydratase
MAERVVVLGSNSFSGSHFVSRLLEQGHHVLGLSRSPEVKGPFNPYDKHLNLGNFTFSQIDLNDPVAAREALLDSSPELVVNFAAQSMVAQSWESPHDWYQTNVMGLVTLATTLEELPNLRKFVHVTTPEVYGSTNGWITERREFYPSTPYAVSRAAGDMHLWAMHTERGLPVCFTRAANVYGPGQHLYRIVPRVLLYARLGRQLQLDGGGHSTRSFIHISDVAEATYRIAQSGTAGETYHISTREIVSIRDLVLRACQLTGVDFESLVVEGPERPGKDATYMLDSSQLHKEFGWGPQYDLAAGLEDTLAWVDANLEELSQAPQTYVHRR